MIHPRNPRNAQPDSTTLDSLMELLIQDGPDAIAHLFGRKPPDGQRLYAVTETIERQGVPVCSMAWSASRGRPRAMPC